MDQRVSVLRRLLDRVQGRKRDLAQPSSSPEHAQRGSQSVTQAQTPVPQPAFAAEPRTWAPGQASVPPATVPFPGLLKTPTPSGLPELEVNFADAPPAFTEAPPSITATALSDRAASAMLAEELFVDLEEPTRHRIPAPGARPEDTEAPAAPRAVAAAPRAPAESAPAGTSPWVPPTLHVHGDPSLEFVASADYVEAAEKAPDDLRAAMADKRSAPAATVAQEIPFVSTDDELLRAAGGEVAREVHLVLEGRVTRVQLPPSTSPQMAGQLPTFASTTFGELLEASLTLGAG